MEVYKITSDDLPITDKHCCTLNNFQLLNIKNNCIFSEIAKYFILKSGYNIEDTYVTIHYQGGNCPDIFNNETIFFNNNSELIHPLMENIITLNDDETIEFYNKEELIINRTKKGECFFIDNKQTEMTYYFSKYASILKIYYYKYKPNVEKIYNNENIILNNIQISSLNENNFLFLDDPIIFYNNTFDRECICNYMNKHQNLTNEKRIIIINVQQEFIKNDITIFNDNNTENELDLVNLYDIRNLYNYHNQILIFDSIKEQELIKDTFLNIKNKTHCDNNFSFKQPNFYFINKINLNKEELLITNIVKEFFYSQLNTKFNPSKHDITIELNSNVCNPFKNELVYKIFIVFEETNENEIIILQDNKQSYLMSNHILFIKPSPINVIGIQKHNMIENKIDSKKFIEISIFNHIPSIKYTKFIENVENKPFLYKNTSITNNDCLHFKLKNNISKIISTKNKDVFTVENIKKIYKRFPYDNTLHFFYKPNITFINENISIKNDDIYVINTTFIHSDFKNILSGIEQSCKNDIEIIDSKHNIFSPVIYIFNNIVSRALNSIFNKEYNFNVYNCSFTANKDEILKEFDITYCDIQDNKYNKLIVYVDICIDTNSEYFGKMDIYTNYVNFSNNLKNILRFVLEVEQDKNVIITKEEQNLLICFANKEYKLIKNNESIFNYGIKNKSWDVNISDIPKNETVITNLIESIRQRIIKNENITFTSEPSKLPSFFQILEEDAATHVHTDSNDLNNYHIRFNLIIQNAEEGGVPVYNGITKHCQEREYVLCRSGLDTHYCSKIKGNKPRFAISFGFNIPIHDAYKYPNIFYDLIQN